MIRNGRFELVLKRSILLLLCMATTAIAMPTESVIQSECGQCGRDRDGLQVRAVLIDYETWTDYEKQTWQWNMPEDQLVPYLDSYLFGPTSRIAAILAANAYGDFAWTGQVHPELIKLPLTTRSCTDEGKYVQGLIDSGRISMDGYDGRLMVNTSCNSTTRWTARHFLRGGLRNGSMYGLLATQLHEVGHWVPNDGHPKLVSCGNNVIDHLWKCEQGVYSAGDFTSDTYTPMGVSGVQHYAASSKFAMGWLDEGRFQEITESGEYVLTGYGCDTPGIKVVALRLKEMNYLTNGAYLFLNWRDGSCPFEATEAGTLNGGEGLIGGVKVYPGIVGSGVNALNAPHSNVREEMRLDFSPWPEDKVETSSPRYSDVTEPRGSQKNAALVAGKSRYISTLPGTITVTNVDHDADKLTLRVDLDPYTEPLVPTEVGKPVPGSLRISMLDLPGVYVRSVPMEVTAYVENTNPFAVAGVSLRALWCGAGVTCSYNHFTLPVRCNGLAPGYVPPGGCSSVHPIRYTGSSTDLRVVVSAYVYDAEKPYYSPVLFPGSTIERNILVVSTPVFSPVPTYTPTPPLPTHTAPAVTFTPTSTPTNTPINPTATPTWTFPPTPTKTPIGGQIVVLTQPYHGETLQKNTRVLFAATVRPDVKARRVKFLASINGGSLSGVCTASAAPWSCFKDLKNVGTYSIAVELEETSGKKTRLTDLATIEVN